MRRPGVDLALAGLLALVCTALYAALPIPGNHKWDALMTASVLARPEAVSTREVLFFAHPLVIPLTRPFALVVDDPLAAVALREAVFAGWVVALAYLGTRAAARSRAAGLLAALVLIAAVERWRLATGGEEKQIALAFGATFMLLFLDHRGHLDLGLARLRRLPERARGVLLGALLALATAVHLVNGVLFLVVLADVALDGANRRQAASTALVVLGTAAALCAGFFLWLAIGPGGADSPRAVVGYFLEYHLSGEFVSVPTGGDRLVDAYHGGRTWLIGDVASPAPRLETALALLAAAALAVAAYRRAAAVTARLLVWIGVLALHFLFYEPWDPEAWGPAGLAWAAIGAIAMLGPGRAWRTRAGVSAVLVVLLVGFTVRAHLHARADVAGAARLADGGAPATAPLADVARWVDRRIEPDAILVVGDRYLASYLHIYTDRDPIVLGYLDRTPAELRRDELLTTMSLAFYRPRMGTRDLRLAAAAGRPVYLLTDGDEALARPLDLGWRELRLGRWSP